MKRIISFLLALTMIISLVGGAKFSVFAETAGVKNSDAKLIDIDVYRAQCYAGIAYDPNTNVVEDCNEIYDYYISEGVYSPTKSFLDDVYADDELMAEFALWQLESLGVKASSIIDTPIQKKDYYESLITAIIAHEYVEDSPKTQDLAVQAVGYYATIVDSLCSITDSADTYELMDKLDVNSPDTMKALEQMFNEHPELSGFDVIDIILDASDTIVDAIEKMSAYSTMYSLDQETKAWLESMYNACDDNVDAELKAALFNLMNASFSFTHALLVEIKDTSFRLANWGIGATVDAGLSLLAATNPLTTAIMAGLKLGKTICDICFATSDICEQLFLLECMYDIQSLARTVSEEARINFVNSQTKENAKAFTYAVHYYFESIINTDIDCMISFLDLLYNGGLLKGALTWVYGVTDDYQEAVDSLESLREVRQNNYDFMIKLYKAALAINYKDTYDYYYTVDNTVPITGISFRETWLLPMEVGDFSNIYVQYEPSNTTQKAYTVTSDNPAVVEVHDNIITAIAEGTANVTIRSVENPEVSYTADVTVGAESEGSSSKFTYRVIDDEAIITGLAEGYEPSYLTIPSYVDGYPVVYIDIYAFDDCQNLYRVTISDGITHIGSSAFENCSNLTSVTIPDCVTVISRDTFRGCSSLTSIAIPSNLISIGEYAFRDCSSLTDIYITDLTAWLNASPDDWRSHPIRCNSLKKRIYLNGEMLTDVVIPEGVTTIGDYAFYSCGSLTSVTIPSSVTSIGYGAFYGCDGLTCITIQDAATSIGTYAFSGCGSLTSLTIPDSVTEIRSFAFENCENLTSVTIQGGVNTIGSLAFNGCRNLSSVIIRGGVTTIGDRAFSYCSLTELTLPEGVISIGDKAFYYCDNLIGITIPSTVTSIGEDAFFGCGSLTDIYITDLAAWLSISHNGMFSLPIASHSAKRLYLNGKLLTDVVIPEGITTIGDCAFYRCDSLTSITIPSSVTSIGEYAFYMCDSLTDIYITDLAAWLNISYDGPWSIPTYANNLEKQLYLDEVPMTAVIIPDSITVIGDYTFRNCNSLTSVKVSDEVTAIGVSAFANCTSLKQIELPDSITSIGDSAFAGCSSLTDITIPDSITAIGERIFDSCTSLRQVEIPDGVISIGDYAFIDCSSLSSIIIPDSIATIGDDAFMYCTGLNEVFFEGNAPEFGKDALYCTRVAAYYPVDNATWNEETMQQYGGNITWIAYNPNHKHEYATVATPPTCTEMGFTTYTCNCGDSYVGDYVNALGHDYVESICTRCGEEDPSYQKTTAGTDFNSATQVEINITYTNSTPNPWPYNYYYSFTTSEQGVLYIDFSTTNFTEESTFYLSVYDSDYAEIFRTTSTASTPITTHGLGLSSGLYYIEISPSRLDDYHSFTLTYLSSANWETERNNTFDTADHIIHDQEIYGHLGGSVDDDDYFVFEVNEPGLLDARFYGNLDVRFYNAQQEFLLRESLFEMSPDESSGAIQIGLAPGIYYLNFNVNSTGFYDYRFILNWTAHSEWEAEQNDNIDSATPYTPGDLVSGNLMDMADVDWYSFTIDEACIISLDFTLPEGTSSWPVWYVSLLDSDQFEWMNSVHESYDDNQVRMELQPGEYYLKVYTIDNHHSSANYSLRLSIIHELVNPFSDVTPGSFFYEPVMWAVENGITNGTSATTFGPNDQCMRAQVVTFLWRAVGSPEPTKWDNPFVDVKPSDYYYKPVLWALENGITSGMDATHFGPTSYCNRAQVVTFLYRTMGNPDVGAATNPFTDVAVGSFYEKPVLWAVENGVTAGMSATSFGPNSICNRAQIVTFLYRAFVD